ncbi:POMK (predicted) [Pycnogonum litorale]
MMECHPWLDCNQISRLRIIKLIGEGHVKKAYLAKWNDYNVVINVEKTKMYRNDFLSNIERHRVLNPSSYISQFLGWCNHTYLVEYYPLGASINIHNYLADALPSQNTIDRRFTLCIDYVKILAHLHNHRNGPFVFCDSNHVHKINLQLLLTNDLHLVLNDLDALPVNNGNGIICGQRQLDGDLLAPEQLWPYENKTFDIKLMPSYTEKIDIWKIPDVCDYFLEELNADSLRFSLIRINERCKARKPSLRPSADIVLKEYLEIAKHHGINIL